MQRVRCTDDGGLNIGVRYHFLYVPVGLDVVLLGESLSSRGVSAAHGHEVGFW